MIHKPLHAKRLQRLRPWNDRDMSKLNEARLIAASMEHSTPGQHKPARIVMTVRHDAPPSLAAQLATDMAFFAKLRNLNNPLCVAQQDWE